MNKFKLGQLVATHAVSHTMETEAEFKSFVFDCLERYTKCDWGDMGPEDRRHNDDAVKTGDSRIMASYAHAEYPGWKIWIVTECDRSATTILFPNDY